MVGVGGGWRELGPQAVATPAAGLQDSPLLSCRALPCTSRRATFTQRPAHPPASALDSTLSCPRPPPPPPPAAAHCVVDTNMTRDWSTLYVQSPLSSDQYAVDKVLAHPGGWVGAVRGTVGGGRAVGWGGSERRSGAALQAADSPSATAPTAGSPAHPLQATAPALSPGTTSTATTRGRYMTWPSSSWPRL